MTTTPENETFPTNAFLIVNGAEIFPLTKPVIRIGRMADNDLVLPDSRISRYHAQLRADNGLYVLVDLKSTGGSSIDGKRVHKAALKPGNVVTLAGIPLIYGENAPGLDLTDQTPQGLRALRGASPTATDSVDLSSDSFFEMFEPPQE